MPHTASNLDIAKDLSNVSDIDILDKNDVAHIFINHHKVVSSQTVEGLSVDLKEEEDHVLIKVDLADGAVIEKPVHMCFGMLETGKGEQKLKLDVRTGDDSQIQIVAHCAFPGAEEIKHMMDARIEVGRNSLYSYFERHIHGPSGLVQVIPKSRIQLREGARFRTEFELIRGRAGLIDIDYETHCDSDSVLEMMARIYAKEEDVVNIREVGYLDGDRSRGFLNSRVAARGNSKADVYNELVAAGAYARGHVDCTEIIQDNGTVSAVPIVKVTNPKAHITHEASLGSVDSKQLQTLMARGLSEEDAIDLIIQGLLS